jgi:nitrite reductase/ring-hydroxylating ferredoxin subunit
MKLSGASRMEVEVAKVTEIPSGGMRKVRAFDQDVLLSNVDGRIYATSNRCGHENASLARGSLQGKVVTCPLHRATFDVTSGKNLSGPQLSMPPEVMQKLPKELLEMMKQTAEIVSEIQSEPLRTYKVNIRENSIFLQETA